jgi:exosome complex component RRP4
MSDDPEHANQVELSTVPGEDRVQSEREIVTPGDLIDEGRYKPGIGTYKIGQNVYAAQLGIKSIRSDYINVISLAGRYIPKPTDNVIGMVIDLTPTSWIIDINSPYNAILHSSEVQWRVDYGDTSKYLNIGDNVLAMINSVDETKRVQVTMRGPGLRKLNGGQLLEISPTKIPRLIGKSGSMISLIKNYTRCQLFAGQNGRIWMEGRHAEIHLATVTINIIERAAHISGLTSKTEEFLKNNLLPDLE